MSLRKRVALAAGGAVAVAVVLVAIVCYIVVRGQLLDQVDSALNAQENALLHQQLSLGQALPGIPASAGGPAQYYQIVLPDGSTPVGNLSLPVTDHVLGVASGEASSFRTDVTVGGSLLRQLTFSALMGGQPVAVQLARPLNGVDNILARLRLILFVLLLAGIGLAVLLGRLAADRVLAPLAEVAETAQEIGETDDLSRRLRIHADDEVGQLARRFNAMLETLESSRAALDESVRAQRQLVADASHELRTPVTSLRTNVEVLLEHSELGEAERERLLADVVEQSEELTTLVGDLIELARGDQPAGELEDVRLDQVAEESVAWARRNAQNVTFETRFTPASLEGRPERLLHAINNLLDNAARHSPPGGVIEVTVDGDGVRVRDHGAGVDEDDLPYVFDRFYRGANSRGSQGSGLGLAIVRQVAEQHGGSATVANAPDGGAVFTLHLPVHAVEPAIAMGQDGNSLWAHASERAEPSA